MKKVFSALLMTAIFSLFQFSQLPVYSSENSLSNNTSSSQAVVLPAKTGSFEHLFNLPGLDNVGRISPKVFRGNQPKKEGYKTLKEIGIKTVINLRSRHYEKDMVESAGMRYLEFPIGMLEKAKKNEIRKIVQAMADPANQPVYVHCALGQDRTGIVVAAYRMDIDGWSLAEAEKEMQAFGFNDTWVHLKKFIRKYPDNSNSREKPE
jgi:tyrosine-protein phosphatase SIW14